MYLFVYGLLPSPESPGYDDSETALAFFRLNDRLDSVLCSSASFFLPPLFPPFLVPSESLARQLA